MEELTTTVNKKLGEMNHEEIEGTQDAQQRVEEKVDKLMEMQRANEGPKQIKGCIQECVNVSLKEDREEEEEQQRRKTGLIIHRLEEEVGGGGGEESRERHRPCPCNYA